MTDDSTPTDPDGTSEPAGAAGTDTTDTADTTTTRAARVRRTKIIAAILLGLGALLFWVSSRLTWATVFAGDGMSPDRYMTVKGADWSPWLTPLALVLLAAILAAFSLRGWGLRVLAVLVAVGGLLAAFPALSMVTSSSDSLYAARAIDLADKYVVRLTTTNGWVAAVVIAGTVCCVLAGILLLRAASGAAMSSKYTTPAARREELEREIFAEHKRRKAAADNAEDADNSATDGTAATGKQANERMMWDALDTGIDPTDQR
ncbi:TIGR02234 family membrane protein [Gordonia sp. VNQ95]|uniref:TIGR02234 family membrane protein n=1 Tax=Gordonia sp. VNQ95 TaxID=3156619 RepID=UPI0032B3C5C3